MGSRVFVTSSPIPLAANNVISTSEFTVTASDISLDVAKIVCLIPF